jgi:hypothetical protein
MPDNTFELVIEGTGAAQAYIAFVPDDKDNRAPDYAFEGHQFSVVTALGELAGVVQTPQPPEKPVHENIRQKLFQAVFAGVTRVLWTQNRQAAKRSPNHLVLSIHLDSARELMKLTSKYLHDGKGFLALDRARILAASSKRTSSRRINYHDHPDNSLRKIF